MKLTKAGYKNMIILSAITSWLFHGYSEHHPWERNPRHFEQRPAAVFTAPVPLGLRVPALFPPLSDGQAVIAVHLHVNVRNLVTLGRVEQWWRHGSLWLAPVTNIGNTRHYRDSNTSS